MSIENAISGKIVYSDSIDLPVGGYDYFCKPYLEPYPWTYLLAYLFFGSSISQPLSYKESLFLPYNLEAAFQTAVIVTDSISRPLTSSFCLLVEDVPKEIASGFFTPSTLGWILLILILLLSWIEWKKKSYFRAVDYTLFGIAGLLGIILFLLNTVFSEWYIRFGHHLIWLHPLHLLAVVFFACRKWDKQAYGYHLFNLAALLVGIIVLCYFGISVKPLAAVVPYMLMLGTRSIFGLMRYYKNKK